MTKAEIIRKMVKQAGIPDSEAKVFFEMFLMKAAELLKPGESVKLKGLGYFQLKRGMFKDLPINAEQNSKKLLYVDLITFTPTSDTAGEENSRLIFNVPTSSKQMHEDNVDSYFSLSIGKQSIPFEKVSPDEIYIPPTGLEMKRLVESKVSGILKDAEVIDKYIKGNEVLYIDTSSKQEQMEFLWEEGNSQISDEKFEDEPDNADADLTEYENISWDFGDNLSKQLEEESILDFSSDDEEYQVLNGETEGGLSWDFGDSSKQLQDDDTGTASDENIKNEVNYEKDSYSDSKFDDDYDEILDKSLENYHEDLQDKFPEDSEEDEGENKGNFQRVKSLTSEYIPEKENSDNAEDAWNFDKFEADEDAQELANDFLLSDEEEIEDENGFKKVAKRSTTSIELGFDEEKRLSELIEVTEKETKDNSDSENLDDKIVSGLDEIKKSKTGVDSKKYRRKSREYSRGSSTGVFFIALITIILVGSVLFIYLQKVNLNIFDKKKTPVKAEKVKSYKTEVINRNFDIPISYPYNKDENNLSEASLALPASVFKFNNVSPQQSQRKITQEKPKKSTVITHKTVMVKPAKKNVTLGEGKKVKGNIYRYTEGYVVQVSSWRRISVAEKQVAVYQKRGFKAFIQKAEIPGRGTWYRVRIGYFNSVAEAEKVK